MLRDGGDKLFGREDLKVALGLGVHARTVDHGAVLGVVDHLLLGEGVADNVLGDAFKPGGIVAPQRLAVVHAEPACPEPVEGLCFQLRSLRATSGASNLVARAGAYGVRVAQPSPRTGSPS